MRHASILLLALVGCYQSDPPSCTISCATDADCLGDLTCSPDGKCSEGATACTTSCTPGTFINCSDATTLQQCNASGDGLTSLPCGAMGCNTSTQACNVCVPSEASCTVTGELQTCNAEGSAATPVSCALGCAAADATVAAHCRYIEPQWLPNICDVPATIPATIFAATSSLDTTTDAICTQIADQTLGLQFCVIRAKTIQIASSRRLTVTGQRLLALVSDDDLNIDGILDVSATGILNGPGGGAHVSGTRASGASGGGGPGFKTAGGPGGGPSGPGAGGIAGPLLNPLGLNHMIGGPHPPVSMMVDFTGRPGGAGGGVTLISCRGTVRIDGGVVAGGGGGEGGRDTTLDGLAGPYTGAGPGGAGGYVVIQGAQVNIAASAGMFANGGGGGGGTVTTDTAGVMGQDGPESTLRAMGGGPTGGAAGAGGAGGAISSVPGSGGGSAQSGGGGGGSTGVFQIYTPVGVTPASMPTSPSPAFESNRTIMTR